LATALALVLVAGVFVAMRAVDAAARTMVVGYFDNSNGVFVGDDVRIRGVSVGKIEKIEPQPLRSKISFWFDRKYKVPANAKAAILSPQLVTGRAIQLTPPYTGGPAMQDGAVIPQDRTVVPVEWDDLRAQVERLTDLRFSKSVSRSTCAGKAPTSATPSSNCRRRFQRSATTARTSSPRSRICRRW
jgi:phospholipid/cholesterol/gamma-HCH transport system substrate-binding protein